MREWEKCCGAPMYERTNGNGAVYLECASCWRVDPVVRRVDPFPLAQAMKKTGVPHETTSPHGYGRYSRGCRCDVCREAHTVYHRNRQARRRTAVRGPGILVGWKEAS